MESLSTAQIQDAAEPYWTGTAAVQEEYIPVVHAGTPIAVVTRETSVGVIRGGRIVEREMEEIAEVLCKMTASGEFPIQGAGTTIRHGTPRVADGVLRLDEEGRIVYVSPNGRSCFHRLGIEGELEGILLAEAVTSIIPARTPVDETLAVVLMGRQAWLTEVEVGGVFLSVRSIPLTLKGRRSGAVLLVRDVTEVRRREQVLLNKDATIREVHHRVKNNLQTVSALLRMQARRASNEETRQALSEAERRVTTIATVHDALSHNVNEHVDFDEVFSSILRMAAVVATPTGSTAYALSVGGPLMHPSLHGFVLAPVAPQSLSARPIILPDQCEVELTIRHGRNARLNCDMQSFASLQLGDRVVLHRSADSSRFLHPPGYSYYATLRTKLNWHEIPGLEPRRG